jgi:hypothetical protein
LSNVDGSWCKRCNTFFDNQSANERTHHQSLCTPPKKTYRRE